MLNSVFVVCPFLHCGSTGIRSLEPGLTQAEDQAADLFEHGEGQQHTKNLALSKGFRQLEAFRDADQKAHNKQNMIKYARNHI